MIRAMAMGDVHMKDWVRLLEGVLVSLLLGAYHGSGCGACRRWRAPEIMLVVVLAMVISWWLAACWVCCSLYFTRLKLDPATAVPRSLPPSPIYRGANLFLLATAILVYKEMLRKAWLLPHKKVERSTVGVESSTSWG